MNRFWAPSFVLFLALLTLSCGSSSNRQLQSITIAQTVNGQQISFVATGHFSSAPTTVTPIAVLWSFGLIAPPPPRYTLSPQTFVMDCTVPGPSPSPIAALAPSNPSAPLSGPWSSVKMISASSPVTCP